jgi:hypothetical protein
MPLAVAFLASGLGLSQVQAQALRDTLFEEVRAKLEPLIAAQRLAQPLPAGDAYNLYIVDAILNLKDQGLEPVNKDQLYNLQIKQVEKDWGLNIRTQFNHNFDQSFLIDEEADAQINPTRFRLGLEWDLFSEGFLAHKNKSQQLRNEKEMDWLAFDQRRNQERHFYRANILAYFFNQEKILLLRERKNSLEQQLALLYRIYFLRDILFDEIIAMKGDLEQVEVQLKHFVDYNAYIESILGIDRFAEKIDVAKLPIVDLDIHRMLQDTGFNLANETIAKLMAENERLKASPVNDISLRLQLHQNLGLSNGNGSHRVYTSAGLTASIPFEIFSAQPLNTEIGMAKNLERQQWQQYEDLTNTTDILNLYYEFNYKLKQYVAYLYKHLLYEEKLRVEQVNRAQFTDYYQPFQLLGYQDNLYAVQLELLDLKQQLYTYLLRIYAKTGLKSLRPYLLPVSMGQYLEKLPGSRTIIVKAGDFDHFDQQFIDNYLKFNDFRFAILQESDLVDLSPHRGLQHFASTSKATLVKSILWNESAKNLDAYADEVTASLEKNGFGGFLLYVHPQDSKHRGTVKIQQLVARMQEFIHHAQNKMPGTVAFVSLPVDFPMTELTGLGPLTEKIILRVEAQQDITFLQNLPKRILPFEQVPVCLSVNVRQFSDRLKLEAFIQEVLVKNRINDVVFNDFQAFVEMETKMFSQ